MTLLNGKRSHGGPSNEVMTGSCSGAHDNGRGDEWGETTASPVTEAGSCSRPSSG